MKVSIPPSGRIIACVSGALSYCSSSRFCLANSLSCGGLVVSGSDEVESAGGGGGVLWVVWRILVGGRRLLRF